MPKNEELPGMERPKIKEIESAADAYVSARDRRMKLTESEIAAKAKLIETVQKFADKLNVDGDGNRIYRYDDLVVILSDKVNVKVKSASEPEADED